MRSGKPLKGAASLALALLCAIVSTQIVLAHQPFFEEPDTTASTPMRVRDPVISTALFSTLERPDDVDFFTFDVSAGQTIEIGMTIPQIAGQEQFAPHIGVLAAGLESGGVSELPEAARVLDPSPTGAMVFEPAAATVFFEPFSRTAYWRRQREKVTFPEDGEVLVVVWHSQGSVGRYTLVVGQREVPGGDSDFSRKLKAYWTPIEPGLDNGTQPDSVNAGTASTQTGPASGTPEEGAPRCNWLVRLLAALFGSGDICA